MGRLKPCYTIREKIMFWVAWKLPRWLVYFATLRLFSEVITKGELRNRNPMGITYSEAVEVWGVPR